MRLSRFLQRTRALGDTPLNAVEIDALEDAIDRGDDLPALVKARPLSYTSLTPRNLLIVWRAHQALKDHLRFLEEVGVRRREAGMPAIPTALLAQTIAHHEIAVLERADLLAPLGAAAEHRRRDAIKEALLVWNACLAIARRDGMLVTADVANGPEADALRELFGHLAGREKLAEIPPHRWLALRRGRKSGALSMVIELPVESLLSQVTVHYENLKAIANGRDARSLAQVLIFADMPAALLATKDEEAETRAITTASETYLGLLTSNRPKVSLAAGVFVPRKGAQLPVAIVGRDGRVVHATKVSPGDDPVAAVLEALEGHDVDGIVLPSTSEDLEMLNRLAGGFPDGLPVHRVKPTALKEGAEAVTEELPPQIKFAVVLARRCIRPMRTWSQVDPVSLGLAEYQQDLDENRLRRALVDVQSVALAGVKPDDLSKLIAAPAATPAPKPVAAAPRVPAAPLNPLIKGVDDLRPGMKLNGVVANITQFGAFVNIGLQQEGLIHVSELADHFVKDPNEVVKVGQTISARVLGIDRVRGRISLSLKSERGTQAAGPPSPDLRPAAAPPPRGPEPAWGSGNSGGGGGGDGRRGGQGRGGHRGGGGGGGGGGGKGGGAGGGGGGQGRARALADLEALFRKPK